MKTWEEIQKSLHKLKRLHHEEDPEEKGFTEAFQDELRNYGLSVMFSRDIGEYVVVDNVFLA